MEQFDFFQDHNQTTQDEAISNHLTTQNPPTESVKVEVSKEIEVELIKPSRGRTTVYYADIPSEIEDTNLLLFAINNATKMWKAFKHRRDCIMQIRGFCSFRDFGAKPLSKITVRDLYDYQDYLRTTGLKDPTINRHMSGISAALRFASEVGIIDNYPRARRLKENGGRPRAFSDQEVENIVNYFNTTGDSWMADMVILSCKTGMRRGEILNMNHHKVVIDEDNGTMYLPPEITKTSRGRDVPLNKEALAALKRLKDTIAVTFTHGNFYDRWWNCREHLGYRNDPTFVFHVCRHTALTNMAKNNVNSLVIGEIAGHSSLQTTMKYVHADAKTRANAVAGI